MKEILRVWLLASLGFTSMAWAGNWTLQFDGIDDYVSILSSPLGAELPASGFTYEGWIFCGETSISRGIYYNGPVLESSLSLESGALLGFYVKFADVGWEGVQVPVSYDTWFHFAAVYDRIQSESRLYVNGVLEGAIPIVGSLPQDWFGMGFGAYMPIMPPEEGTTFDGRIDCFRVTEGVRYTDDFTPETQFAVEAGTLALWDFEEGSGISLHDQSGDGHDGVIHGAIWVQESAAAEPSSWSRLKALY